MDKQLILFTAEWCNPCKELKLWMGERDISGVTHVDVEAEPEFRIKSGVKAVPSMLANGKLLVGREEIKPYLEGLTNGTKNRN